MAEFDSNKDKKLSLNEFIAFDEKLRTAFESI